MAVSSRRYFFACCFRASMAARAGQASAWPVSLVAGLSPPYGPPPNTA
ncbi:ash family protein [Pseudomonas sp.]